MPFDGKLLKRRAEIIAYGKPEIDWTHPLARGLIHLFPLHEREGDDPVDLVTRRKAPKNYGTNFYEIHSDGSMIRPNGSNILTNSRWPTGNKPYAFSVWFGNWSAIGSGNKVCLSTGVSGNSPFLGKQSTELAVHGRWSFGTMTNWLVPTELRTRPILLSGSYAGGTAGAVKLYVNGIERHSNTNSWNMAASPGVYIGDHAGAGASGNAAQYHACFWDRELTDAEQWLLWSDPWGIFKQPDYLQVSWRKPVGPTIRVPLKTFSLTGLAPTVTAVDDIVINVPAKAFTLTGNAPAVASGVNVESPVGSFTLTGLASAVGTSVAVESPAKVFNLSAFAPAVATGASVASPARSFSLSGLAPNVGTGVSIATPGKAFSLAGFAPTIAIGVNIKAPLKQFLLSGPAPTVVARSWTKLSPAAGSWTKISPVSTVWTRAKG